MAELYATDLSPEKQTDAFMGEGFEDALKKAQDNEEELIIGEYFPNEKWRGEE